MNWRKEKRIPLLGALHTNTENWRSVLKVMSTGTAQNLLNDCRRILGPHERCWVVIPVFEVVSDMAGKRLDRVKGAAPNRPAGENAEPRFHHVEPRCTSRGEMKVYCRMGLQPGQHLWCLVG